MRASSLPLLTKCTGSLILPCDHDKSEAAQEAADWGSMVHYWAQHGEVKGFGAKARRHKTALLKAIEISGIDRESYWPTGGVHEGALSIRVDGIRETSRDDTEREGWITGHYDYQYWIWGGELWIDDLKTGKYYPNPMPGMPGWEPTIAFGENRYPQDAGSAQLKCYALAVKRLLSYTGSTNISLTHWPRLPLAMRHALPTRSWAHFTEDELESYWSVLEKTYADSKHNERAMWLNPLGAQEPLILNPGAHCRFCPARNDCFVASEF